MKRFIAMALVFGATLSRGTLIPEGGDPSCPMRLLVLRLLESQPAQTWDKFGRQWTSAAKADLERTGFALELSNPHSTHPMVRSARLLGWEFGEGRGVIAPFSSMLARYDELLSIALRENGLTEADSIRPGRAVFCLEDSSQRFIGRTEEPVSGDDEDHPGHSPRLMGKMIQNGFYYPGRGRTSIHDFLGHLGGFLEQPKYMAKLRAIIRRPHELPPLDFYLRYVYLLEGLSLVDKTKQEQLLQFLDPAFTAAGEKLVTVWEIEERLHSYDPTDVATSLFALLKEVPKLVIHYGGSSREVHRAAAYSPNSEMRQTLMVLAHDTLQAAEDLASETSERAYLKLIARFAQLQVALRESSRIEMEDFADQLMSQTSPVATDVYRMFVLSGISDDIGYLSRHDVGRAGPGLMQRSLERGLTAADAEEFAFSLPQL